MRIVGSLLIFFHSIFSFNLFIKMKVLFKHSSSLALLKNSQGKKSILRDTVQFASGIDRKLFSAIYFKYKNINPYPGSSKYLDVAAHLSRAIAQAHKLGLNKSSKKKILDLGAGAGFFCFSCNYYGHQSVAMDIGEVEMYREMLTLLHIPQIIHQIRPFQPMPKQSNTFDLITAFQLLFDRYANGDMWNIAEWRYFLKDISNQLKPDGKLLLELNTIYDQNKEIYPRVMALFSEFNAKFIDSHMILMNNVGLQSLSIE